MQGGAPPPSPLPPHATAYNAHHVYYGPAQPSAPPLPPPHLVGDVALGTPSPYASFNMEQPPPPYPPQGMHPQQQEQMMHTQPPAPAAGAPVYHTQPSLQPLPSFEHQHVAQFHASPVSHQRVWGKM